MSLNVSVLEKNEQIGFLSPGRGGDLRLWLNGHKRIAPDISVVGTSSLFMALAVPLYSALSKAPGISFWVSFSFH